MPRHGAEAWGNGSSGHRPVGLTDTPALVLRCNALNPWRESGPARRPMPGRIPREIRPLGNGLRFRTRRPRVREYLRIGSTRLPSCSAGALLAMVRTQAHIP